MTEPTIDREAKQLDMREDQKDLARSLRVTKEVVFFAIVGVALALIIGGILFRR